MRLGGWRLPISRLSATSLATYIGCPEQFRQKYLLKQQETMSGERFMGCVTHRAIEYLFDPEWDEVRDEGADIPQIAVQAAWNETIERDGEPEWYDLDASEQFRRAKLMLVTYEPIARSVSPIAVEERFEETILGVDVVGYIDRELEDRILEVKTSSRKESKPKSRWAFQGRLYGLVKSKPVEWHVITRQVTPQVVTAAEAPALLKQFPPNATYTIVKHAIERMNDDYARNGTEQPWPMDGIFGDWACDYCSFKANCPAHFMPEVRVGATASSAG